MKYLRQQALQAKHDRQEKRAKFQAFANEKLAQLNVGLITIDEYYAAVIGAKTLYTC